MCNYLLSDGLTDIKGYIFTTKLNSMGYTVFYYKNAFFYSKHHISATLMNKAHTHDMTKTINR